ncbi:MarR family winged helix-turn-helix transcriptional regulator [Angustibacter aerolatus]
MTATQPDAARCGPDGVDEGVVGQITRLMRQLGSIKAHVSQRRRHGVEYSAYVLLFHLIRHGAMRSSALAEAVVSDPSTVSRQTASLVDLGLVERLPDPADRRAVLLAPTPAGVELFHQMRAERDEMFHLLLDDWSDDDVRDLTRLLTRLTDDMERLRPVLIKSLTENR